MPIDCWKKEDLSFSGMVDKFISRISGWHTKLLPTGGRVIPIRHIFLALPIHVLAAVKPPKGTLGIIEKYVARFFCSNKILGVNIIVFPGKIFSFLTNRGCTNFTRLSDICQDFKAKHWWSLRTTNSLRSEFMKDKYLSSNHPSTTH